MREHETLGIIGLSGCGKSTLLRIISQLESPDTGEVYLGDPHYSLVFQYSALFDSLSVLENVAFSLLEKPDRDPVKCGNTQPEEQGGVATKSKPENKKKAKKLTMRQIREIVIEKLKMVGLEGIEEQYPNSLSGGMKKRVSFGRAIVNNPRINLYDEPTAGLDPVASTMIEEYMGELRNKLNAPSVVLTHQFSTFNRCVRLILGVRKFGLSYARPQFVVDTVHNAPATVMDAVDRGDAIQVEEAVARPVAGRVHVFARTGR